MTRLDLAGAPSIEPSLFDEDFADMDVMTAALQRMRDRRAGGRASARPATGHTIEQIIAAIEELDDDGRRTVLAFLAPNAPDSHVVTLKIAAAHFGKSEKQCIRRAKKLAVFGWKEGNIWFFNLLRPPPGWNPAGRKCPVMSG